MNKKRPFRKLLCRTCGKTFKAHNHKSYCSNKCYEQGRYKKPEVVCLNCKNTFKARATKRSDTGRQKFCSFYCKITFTLTSKPKIKCEHCGKEFAVYPSQLKRNPRYCSAKCADNSRSIYAHHGFRVERITTTCETCEKEFTHRITEPRRYCSAMCANTLPKITSERYTRIHSPRWNAIRKAIIKRDGHKCVKCGVSHVLTVHHIVAWIKTKDDSPSNLITLCRPCHWAVEWMGASCPKPPP